MKMVISVPVIPPSFNNSWAGMHWTKRAKLAKLWHWMVAAEVKAKNVQKFTGGMFPVNVHCQVFHKGKRRRDNSNEMLSIKLAEDSLVAAGVIPDDNPDYVGHVGIIPSVYGCNSEYTEINITWD